MVRRALAAAASLALACQGSGKPADVAQDARHAGSGVAGFGSQHRQGGVVPEGSGDALPPDEGSDMVLDLGSGSGSGSDDAAEPITDAGKALFEMGAVPAWQTVIDRTKYLERRKQHGVAYGVLGGDVMVPAPPDEEGSGSATPPARGSAAPPKLVPSAYQWLVDDTEGLGSLAIRVKLPDNARVHPQAGDRVALGGAWALDDERRWYWKVDAITALPPEPPAKYPWGPPGHTIANGDLPVGARTISVAKEGDNAYFMLVGPPPVVEGDGWPIADELGNPVYAVLQLPGDRVTYGAQDMRAADERWSLKRGQTYVVRLGKIRKRAPDKPLLITAKSGPIRVK